MSLVQVDVLALSCIIAALENYGLSYNAKRLYEVFEISGKGLSVNKEVDYSDGVRKVASCLSMLKNAVQITNSSEFGCIQRKFSTAGFDFVFTHF
jgi:hypothetical protein